MTMGTQQCARCYVRAGTNGLCAVHSRRRLTMLRRTQRRREARRAYEERLVLFAGRAICDWEASHG